MPDEKDNDLIFKQIGYLLLSFKIMYIICRAAQKNAILKDFILDMMYYTNWSFYTLVFSLLYPKYSIVNAIAIHSTFLASIGFWSVIVPASRSLFNLSQSVHIPENLLTHLFSMIVAFYAWKENYLIVNKDEIPIEGWLSFIISSIALIFCLGIATKILPLAIHAQTYPTLNISFTENSTTLVVLSGISLSALLYNNLI